MNALWLVILSLIKATYYKRPPNGAMYIYEARTLLIIVLGVSLCRTRISVRHDTGTYEYTEIYNFLKLLSVSMSVSVVHKCLFKGCNFQ